MNRNHETEPGGHHPPAPGDAGYEDYVPHYFSGLRPIKRYAPFSKMSCVFLMHDSDRGENVILKMPAGMRMAQAVQRQWIQHEISVLREFQHAFAPVLLADGTDKYGLPWFTLRAIEGPTLDQSIGYLSFSRSLELMLELCDVVGALHRAGLIHRDIKPENVMLAQDQHIRLIDFGIAGPPGDGVHATGAGSRPYAPPEQGTDQEQCSTDVYALGLVLYELVTSSRVLPSKLAEDRSQAFPTLRSRLRSRLIRAMARPLLASIILRCLHDNPEHRFSDASQLEKALRWYVRVRSFRHVWGFLAFVIAGLGLLSLLGYLSL